MIDANIKPFKCHHCGRSFGRQDVLGRHIKLHTDRNIASNSPKTFHGGSNEYNLTAGLASSQNNFHQNSRQHEIGSSELLESGNLLDWLMTDLNGAVPLPLIDPSLTPADDINTLSEFEYSTSGGPDNSALSQSYRMIDDLSKRLNSEVYQSGFTSSFLDSCLLEFFRKFSPSFPIIHEQTFSSACTIPPLLLNMVALGSLFVFEKDASEKGELLWRLGHAAVATSWQTLMKMRGPWDCCDGVQLVLTALLGQTYALLSSNTSIRTTASVFHGLGFYWARSSGMYFVRDILAERQPSLDMPEEEKNAIWRSWAATEVQRRAVLGHYILDGLISQVSGSPASARHLINSIGTTCSDAAFAAKTADDWIIEITRSAQGRLAISEAFTHIFALSYVILPLNISQFSIYVIIEGLQSLVADLHETSGPVVGSISKSQIIQALLNIHSANIKPLSAPSDIHQIPILIRWHCICIEVAAPSISLYRWLCNRYQIPQTLGGVHAKGHVNIDLLAWVRQADSLRAVLHAISIIRLLDNLPLNQVYTMHIPTAVFASAMVMSTICLLKSSMIQVPDRYTWQDVWIHHSSSQDPREQGIEEFLQILNPAAHDAMTTINLLDEMNSLQMILRTIISRWGVSAQMCEIVERLARIAREHPSSL